MASAEDVLELVSRGMSNRVERRTDLNEHSSRSHLVVTIYIVRTPKLCDGATMACRMHLVDLAGSENAKVSEPPFGAPASSSLNSSADSRSPTLCHVLVDRVRRVSA